MLKLSATFFVESFMRLRYDIDISKYELNIESEYNGKD